LVERRTEGCDEWNTFRGILLGHGGKGGDAQGAIERAGRDELGDRGCHVGLGAEFSENEELGETGENGDQ
jgi:hypothetical protein